MRIIKKPRLTILMGTCNRLPLLKKCLPILLKTQTPIQLIILDAGSTDGTVQYVKKNYPGIYVHTDKRKIGQAKSFNKTLKNIKTEYICWLSDDNIIVNSGLDIAASILDTHKNIGMVGLKVKDTNGQWKHEPYIGGIWPSGVLNMNQGMIRMKLFHKIKFFDEKFPDYGMDADLTTKVLLTGYKVVLTKKIVIFHMRDYKKYPGAFRDQQRNSNMQLALYIYNNKYKKLCERYMKKKITYLESLSNIIRLVLSHLFGFRRFGFSFEKMLGYGRRDFINVIEAEFVSKLDLWYNRKKPYYLVQEIPEKLRK
jgi:GT2 family glycosyltransferase